MDFPIFEVEIHIRFLFDFALRYLEILLMVLNFTTQFYFAYFLMMERRQF